MATGTKAGSSRRAPAARLSNVTPSDTFPAPIFILAPPRSFTSIISGVIGQHPQLFDSPELNLFCASTMSRFIGLTRLQMGLKRCIAQLYAGEQTIEAVEMASHWLLARRDRTTAEVHRELCAKIAPRILVQKSPRYQRRLAHMEGMLAAFPKARFIHLVRHPRGMCTSYMEMHDPASQLLACAGLGAVDRSGPQPVADPQILWHDYNLRILRFQQRIDPSRWLCLKGEDLLADIDHHLKSLCAWLGISGAPEAIAAMKQPEASPFACFGPLNAVFGNDPKFLRDPHLRPYKRLPESLDGPLPWRPDGASFHPRVVEMAQSFGYT